MVGWRVEVWEIYAGDAMGRERAVPTWYAYKQRVLLDGKESTIGESKSMDKSNLHTEMSGAESTRRASSWAAVRYEKFSKQSQ